jgi:predicted enzyme related to lactoylglutathione lyase
VAGHFLTAPRAYVRRVRLHNVTFDAQDPAALAAFWSAVLERPVADGANRFVAMIDRTPTDPRWLFIRVPEDKSAKNRMHVDLDCDDLGAARSQLEALGASFVHEKDEYGIHWLTFRDPEGNEFCVASHEADPS